MPGIKALKTRIKSIGSTRKITRAMQMVSAAKMRKAQAAALNSRTYSELAWELIHNLSQKITSENPLLKTYPDAKKTGIVIISTNKGLVGGFNANLMAKLKEVDTTDMSDTYNKSYQPLAELLIMGRKAKDFAVRFNKPMMADFPKNEGWVSIENIYPLAKMVSDIYSTGQYKQIVIIYNQFVSTLVQKATIKQLLPFTDSVIARSASDEAISSNDKITSSALAITATEYLFEPSPELVLNNLLPRIIESQIYQAVLESDASEHSARMVMMKNATEAAGDLIADYTLTYNQLRQNKITTELSEITAGRIALE